MVQLGVHVDDRVVVQHFVLVGVWTRAASGGPGKPPTFMWTLHTTLPRLVGQRGDHVKYLWLQLDSGGGSLEERAALLSRLGPLWAAGASQADLATRHDLASVVDAVSRWPGIVPGRAGELARPRTAAVTPAGPATATASAAAEAEAAPVTRPVPALVRVPPRDPGSDHPRWDAVHTLTDVRRWCALPLPLPLPSLPCPALPCPAFAAGSLLLLPCLCCCCCAFAI